MYIKCKHVHWKKRIYFFGMLGITLLLTACSVKKLHTGKLRDIEFAVMDYEDLPGELQKKINEKKKETMMLTYSDKGWTYIVRGYGTEEKTGYSVSVNACYEEEQSIVLETELLGPNRSEKIKNKKTYPYVVIKIEDVDKSVLFQ